MARIPCGSICGVPWVWLAGLRAALGPVIYTDQRDIEMSHLHVPASGIVALQGPSCLARRGIGGEQMLQSEGGKMDPGKRGQGMGTMRE